MKNSKQNLSKAGQSNTEKKPSKHDVNLQKNSSLYFQIGLILCLLGTYALLEMQFEETKLTFNKETALVEDVIMIDFTVPPKVVEPKKQQQPKRKQVKLIDIIKVVEDDNIKSVEEDIIVPVEKTTDKPPVKISALDNIELPDDDEPVFINLVQKVPVYPGCEKQKTNAKRKKCMSEKLARLISKRFNTDIAIEHGLSGKQRITTQFTIDKNGNVTDVKVRAPHNALEKEAERLINRIPEMQPGLQRNKPVGVIYTLPIVFEVRD